MLLGEDIGELVLERIVQRSTKLTFSCRNLVVGHVSHVLALEQAIQLLVEVDNRVCVQVGVFTWGDVNRRCANIQIEAALTVGNV